PLESLLLGRFSLLRPSRFDGGLSLPLSLSFIFHSLGHQPLYPRPLFSRRLRDPFLAPDPWGPGECLFSGRGRLRPVRTRLVGNHPPAHPGGLRLVPLVSGKPGSLGQGKNAFPGLSSGSFFRSAVPLREFPNLLRRPLRRRFLSGRSGLVASGGLPNFGEKIHWRTHDGFRRPPLGNLAPLGPAHSCPGTPSIERPRPEPPQIG